MSSTKPTTTKSSSSTTARAERLAKRATSAPAPETPASSGPQPHASLPAIPEGNVPVADAAVAPNTTAVAATTAVATQVEHEHPVIDIAISEDPATPTERAHSVFDVDGDESPMQEKGVEVDTAPTYATFASSFPPLPASGVEIQTPVHKGKGKKKDVASDEDPDASSDEEARDPTLARDMAAARALSLGQQPSTNTPGASSSNSGASSLRNAPTSTSSSRTSASSVSSSSRRPKAAPGSPPKRARANTAGDAHPAARSPSPSLRGRIPNPSAVHTADPFNPPRIDRARYGTDDGNPPRGAFTAPPPGGWRPIFGIDSESIWVGHPAPQREMWDREPHPKFLAIPSGGNGDRLETRRRIAEAIADRLNINPTRVVVGPPSSPESGSDARAWLIMGLPQRLAQTVLDDRQLCCKEITVYFLPYTPSIAGFLVGFTGFTLHHRTGAPAALEHITEAISCDRTITQFVRAHRDAFPPHVDGDEAVEIFIASIGIDGMEIINYQKVDGREVEVSRYAVFNVYAISPTDNVAHFNELRNLVGALTIHTSTHGQGRRYKNVECRLCPGIDHPTPVCRLPDTDNWLGATPTTIKALEDVSRAARKAPSYGGSGSGNGRGRGRGGYGARGGRNPRGGRGRGN